MAECTVIVCYSCKKDKVVTHELGGPVQLICDDCHKAKKEEEESDRRVAYLYEFIYHKCA